MTDLDLARKNLRFIAEQQPDPVGWLIDIVLDMGRDISCGYVRAKPTTEVAPLRLDDGPVVE